MVADEGTSLLAAARRDDFIQERITICTMHKRNTLTNIFGAKNDKRVNDLYWKAVNCVTDDQQDEVEANIKLLSEELKAAGRGSKVKYTLHEGIYKESDSLLPTDIPFPRYGIISSQSCESTNSAQKRYGEKFANGFHALRAGARAPSWYVKFTLSTSI